MWHVSNQRFGSAQIEHTVRGPWRGPRKLGCRARFDNACVPQSITDSAGELEPRALAAVGAVAWYGYKRFVKEAERVSQKMRQAEREAQPAG